MKQTDYLEIVPNHFTGKEIEAIASTELPDNPAATIFYATAKQRLLNVNTWHRVAGFISATFQVVDKDGNEVNREVRENDFIRVDIPGPGSKEGHGFDWVRIEAIKEIRNRELQSIGFRVRPCANPNGNPAHIAHFYDGQSTSNFAIIREGEKLRHTS